MAKRKNKRPERATDGGSAVALSARLGRPGGAHGRRKQPRAPQARAAIERSKED